MKYYIIRISDNENHYKYVMTSGSGLHYGASPDYTRITAFKSKTQAQNIITAGCKRDMNFWHDMVVVNENELVAHIL
jgi:hypothetical protein